MHDHCCPFLTQAEPAKWAEYVAAEPGDLAQLVDGQLQSVGDWEANFKALKVSRLSLRLAAL